MFCGTFTVSYKYFVTPSFLFNSVSHAFSLEAFYSVSQAFSLEKKNMLLALKHFKMCYIVVDSNLAELRSQKCGLRNSPSEIC